MLNNWTSERLLILVKLIMGTRFNDFNEKLLSSVLLPRSGSGFTGPPACFTGFSFTGWTGSRKNRKVFAEGFIYLISLFQRTLFGSHLALALLIATSNMFSLRGGKILAEKSGGALRQLTEG
jgi:hypothetical protein